MIDEVIRDHDLPYFTRKLFEPPDKSWTWCGEFADPSASADRRTFEVCVRWPYGSNYESVKADLTRQLLARFKQMTPGGSQTNAGAADANEQEGTAIDAKNDRHADG